MDKALQAVRDNIPSIMAAHSGLPGAIAIVAIAMRVLFENWDEVLKQIEEEGE